MDENNYELPARLCSPVAVVCHDAGAANLIFAWLKDWARLGLLKKFEVRCVLEGPALLSWQEQLFSMPNVSMHFELSTAMAGAKCVLTGTGWASQLEHNARNLASLLSIPSIAVIDHWVNYPQRFERAGTVVLPDLIWVSDAYAADIARTQFKDIEVFELPNTYLSEMTKAIPPVATECNNLLYVLEPIRTDWGRGIPGEFQALDFFAKNINVITGKEPRNVVLRPHPSDQPEKYISWIRSQSDLNPVLDQCKNLKDSIANSRWVVGVETYAMVVALGASRETWSSMPPWGHTCRLPQTEIKHLHHIAENLNQK